MGFKTWAVGDKLQAADINTNFAYVTPCISLTSGEAVSAGKAVYVKASDGKVYLTNAAFSDERITSFVGIAMETVAINQPVLIKTQGAFTGYAGLTAGNSVYLADSATAADVSFGNSGTGGSTADIGTTTGREYSFEMTLTSGVKLNSFDITLQKVGSPTGSLTVELRTGSTNTSVAPTHANNGTVLQTVSILSSAISTTQGVLTFTFSRAVATGSYHFRIYHNGTLSDSNNFRMDMGVAVQNIKANYYFSSTWWNLGNGNATQIVTYNFDNTAFTAGDVTDFAYTNTKNIGLAVSSSAFVVR